MKKIISLILALMLIASLSIAAFAEETTGSITINGITDGVNAGIWFAKNALNVKGGAE